MSLSTKFEATLTQLVHVSLSNANYLDGTIPHGLWMLPPVAGGWQGNTKDISSLKFAFIDPPLINAYSVAHQNKAPVKTTIALETQLAYYKMQQRSFCSRHLNPARARTIVTGRRVAHAEGTHQDVARQVHEFAGT